jgi:CRP-like cAMP-binding protein
MSPVVIWQRMAAAGKMFRRSSATRQTKLILQFYAEADPCGGVWILMCGRVALGLRARTGRGVSIYHAEPGAILGLAEALGGNTYSASAVAVTDVEAHCIPIEDRRAFPNRRVRSLPHDPMECLKLIRCSHGPTLCQRSRSNVICDTKPRNQTPVTELTEV